VTAAISQFFCRTFIETAPVFSTLVLGESLLHLLFT